MSSEALRLSNSGLNFAEYGDQFGVVSKRQGLVVSEVDGVMRQVAEQAGFGGTKQFDGLRESARLTEHAAAVDLVSSELEVWQQLVALFGSPDTSSDLVISVVLLFNAHRERLVQQLDQATYVLELRTHELLDHLQLSLTELRAKEAALQAERLQLEAELAKGQSEELQTEINVRALSGEFILYADASSVQNLRTRMQSGKHVLKQRLVQVHEKLSQLRLELGSFNSISGNLVRLLSLTDQTVVTPTAIPLT